uniref:Uncharacterized protein n=1 Tax=Arundo donax TaxID=35708 RepID=A0A0A9HAR1_ARUDO
MEAQELCCGSSGEGRD